MGAVILPFEGVSPKIADDVFVAETAVIIGDVEIGAGSSIWYGCVLRGDVNRIRVGRHTNIQDGSIIHVNHDQRGDGGDPTHIGDGVTIGHMALVHACSIHDEAFIGMRAVVMDNAVVERHAMVAGGAVVTPGKVVRSGELWAGAPAKPMRDLSEQELASFVYLRDHYVELAARHIAEQRKRSDDA